MPIRVAAVIVVALLLVRLFVRWRRREISLRRAGLWAILWLGAAVVVAFPEATVDRLAARLGIETATGIDFVVYVAVALAYYLLFRVFTRLDRVQRETTALVRSLALREARDDALRDRRRPRPAREDRGAVE